MADTKMLRIGFLGSGAQADECEDYAEGVEIAFRAVPVEYSDETTLDIDMVGSTELATPVIAAVGSPGVRRELIESWKGGCFATIVSSRAWVSDSATIEVGSVVAPLAGLAADVEVGRHVLINVGAVLSHDVKVGDYATISPGARIGGRCVIGAGAFIGIGATISNDVTIASGAVIGAGAVVIHDVEVQGVHVGVPARCVRQTKEWLRVI